jgi:hypothetical protein
LTPTRRPTGITGPDQSVNPPEPNANSPAQSINRLAGKAQPAPKAKSPLGRIKTDFFTASHPAVCSRNTHRL